MQWRKPSFIAAHILNGKWIGDLINAHHKEEGDQSAYFGLSYPHCDQQSLRFYHLIYHDRFIHTPIFDRNFNNPTNILEYISKLQVRNTTVLVLIRHKESIESYNFAAFDESFRRRFYEQRTHRITPRRPPDEHWVAVHFRWGDVATENIDKPDVRSGLGFTDYCSCIHYILLRNPVVKIYFFAENFKDTEICIVLKSKRVQVLSESKNWKRDIDIMSQCQLLIGGSSTFFAVGAHLCENCTVIHNHKEKFAMSIYEKTLSKHLNAFYCNQELSCYTKNIQLYFEMQ